MNDINLLDQLWSPLAGVGLNQSFEPRRTNLFVLYVNIKDSPEDSMPLLFYARTAVLPGVTIPEVEDHFMTSRWYYHGNKWEWTPLTATFRYTMNKEKNALSILHSWMRKAVSWESPFISGAADLYAAKGWLVLLDHGFTPGKTFELVRIWPTSIGDIALDYTTGDILGIDATFRYDRPIEVRL